MTLNHQGSGQAEHHPPLDRHQVALGNLLLDRLLDLSKRHLDEADVTTVLSQPFRQLLGLSKRLGTGVRRTVEVDHLQGNTPLHGQVGGNWGVDTTGHHHHALTSGANRHPTGPLDRLARKVDPVEPDLHPQCQVGMVDVNLQLVRKLL